MITPQEDPCRFLERTRQGLKLLATETDKVDIRRTDKGLPRDNHPRKGDVVSTYLHHTPGRLRIKSPSIKRNPPAAAAAIQLVESQEGVMSCNVSTVTGSVLILYDQTTIAVDALLGLLKDGGYIERSTVLNQADRKLEKALSGAGEVVLKAMAMAVVEQVARRSALALVGAIS